MPKQLTEMKTAPSIAMLLVGDPGAGKTGALASLANAGFELRIIDFDNNLAPLISYVDPDKQHLVSAHSLAERVKFDPKTMKAKIGANPKAFSRAMQALDNWNFDDTTLPKLSAEDAGPGVIYILDSLSLMSKTALNWCMAQEGRLGGQPQIQDWGAGGRWVNSFIEALVSEYVGAHVIVITHLTAIEHESGLSKFFPKALSKGTDTEVAKYFDRMLLLESSGSGDNVKRVIRTKATTMFPTKDPSDFKDKTSIKTGLAEYFRHAGCVMPNDKPEA